MATESGEKIWAALAAVQKDLRTQPHTRKVTVKTRTGGDYGYTYTELSALSDYLMPLLGSAGISVTYTSRKSGEASLEIECRLTASDGSHVVAATIITPEGGDAQSVGKTLTYGRRYCLQMATGIATDADTDCAEDHGQASHEDRKPEQAQKAASQSSAQSASSGGDAMTEKQRKMLWAIISKKAPADATPDEKKALIEVAARRACGCDIKAVDKRGASMLIEWLDSATPADFAASEAEKEEVPF